MLDQSSSGAVDLPPPDALSARLASVTRLLLDDVALPALERLRLTRELATIRTGLAANPGALARLKLAQRLAEVRKRLGAAVKPQPAPVDAEPGTDPFEDVATGKTERTSTSDLYDYDPNRKPAQRKRENAAAMDILAQIDAGTLNPAALTAEQKGMLARYSGTGGNLVGADGKKGSAYEYYTPKPIAEGMWSLLRELGFQGGRVLDPAGGVGIFGATAPVNAAVDAVELSETSGRVNQLVNDGPGYKTVIAPFEQVASATPDEVYDVVITNVPFGDVNDRGGNQFKDTKYRNEPLQNYFILRSLEKLRPRGLAAFITPPRCISGKGGKEQDLRQRVSYMAEFVGAYRLPNSVFGTASADTITDVIVFRKFSREVLEKVEELRGQSPQTLLDARVIWPEFIEGNYFIGEGRRFVLGEFVAKDPNKFRDVDRVINGGSMADIAKLLRKFPDSRIDWALLDAAETAPLIYRDGDIINHAGQTLQMRDGRWTVLRSAGTEEAAAEMAESLARCTTPLGAVNTGLSYGAAVRLQTALVESARALDVPEWLRGLLGQLAKVEAGSRESAWSAAVVGLAVDEAFAERQSEETAFDYLNGYPILSEAMKRVASDAARPPTALSKLIKTAMKKVVINYSKRDGFSGVWRGDVVQERDDRSEAQKFEAARYRAGGGAFVPLDQAKALYGEDFDPMADDQWCVSADGQAVARADDYFVGNYADFLARIDAELAAATNDDVRDKLLRQKFIAQSRLLRNDPSQMHFTLFSPFTSLEERAEFVRRFVDPRFSVQFDEETGAPFIGCDITTPKSEAERNLKRFGEYLRTGTVATRSSKGDKENVELERRRVQALRSLVQTSEGQFNSWVKANPVVMARLDGLANDPQRIYFRQVEDDSPLDIPGLNPAWKTHGYQAAWVRKMGREFGGINGDGVGLGKAQPLDARILTPAGWKLMGDMKVGDLVFAADGTAVPVLGVYPQGEREVFEVEFTDGAKTRCCDEHLWFTRTELDIRAERQSEGRRTAVSRPGSVKPLSEIRRTLLRGKKQKMHRIPMVQPVQFAEQALPISPYILGVLIGDGCLTGNSMVFSSGDTEIADRVCHLLKDDFGDKVTLFEREVGDRTPTWSLTCGRSGGKNLALDAVRGLGLTGRQSHDKFIPDLYLRSSVAQRVSLLQGLMDTDGYVSRDGVTVQFTSVSRLLAAGVMELAQSLGGTASISSRVPTFTHRGEKKSGQLAFTVSLRLPPDIEPFALKRKAARVRARSKYLPTRLFSKVTSIGVAQVQCIAVDHPSHLYVTDDYIVTHNTSQGLIAVQHAHSIGTKKRTAFVVPNSVLSNWRKEAARVYADTADCLYVGLRESKTGDFKTDPAAYDADLNKILEGRHRKIFMTYEAFQRLRLRASTAAAYDAYLATVDATYAASDSKADDEVSKSLRAKVIEQLTTASSKSMAAPYFEDLGLDSLVIDEGHLLKNSRGTVDFGGAKFLSLADPSSRGLDAQAKAWFVRKDAPRKDGVILMTATPITNSPLEIYSMLSLAVGDAKLNDLMVGIKGADQFMEVMCQLENLDEETLDGLIKPYNVFTGLNNVGILRNALAATCTIRTAEQVGEQIVMPAASERPTPVALPQAVNDLLQEYKGAFRYAIDDLTGRKENRGDPEAYERVAEKFGEPKELIGHPFNLIQKMGLLIADPELDERATFLYFTPAQAETVDALVAAWNAKPPVEDRARMGPHTSQAAVVGKKTVKDGDDKVEMLRIQARAKIDGKRVVLDTMQPETQAAFDAMADKAGIDFDVTLPPKLAALIENFKHEEANPRGRVEGLPSGRVRQLIFCDTLAMHSKIKRLLVKHCGVSPASIAIITGKVNGKPEEILAVQDGFNAEGEGNKYRVVICNEKAEVGINLQKGTQAIHHLTLGWTPDSLTQRNGRGVRQGNQTGRVTVYHYDADGTFDTYKRMLVGKKSSWIDAVMDPNGGDNVAVVGGLTREQLESLIDSVGDSDAMSRIQARAEAAERLTRTASTRGKQAVTISTIKAQAAFLEKYSSAQAWAAEKFAAFMTVAGQIMGVRMRLDNPKATAGSIVKNQGLLAELQARERSLRTLIESSVKVMKATGYGSATTYAPGTLDDVVAYARTITYGDLNKMGMADRIAKIVRDGINFKFEVSEDTDIGNEWRSEVDQAQAMIDASRDEFKRLGAQEGGIAAEVLERDNTVIDGKVVCEGAFIERSGYLGVVRREKLGLMAFYLNDDGRTKTIAIADELNKGTVTLPGSPGYDELITRAAQIEDAVGGSGQLSAGQLEQLFSATVPQVAQRRAAPMLVKYEARSWFLPSPYFPQVVHTENVDGLRVLPLIASKQSEVVKSTSNSYGTVSFVCESTVGVSKTEPGGIWRNLVDFAKSRGVKITWGDFTTINAYRSNSVGKALLSGSAAPFDEFVLAPATTLEGLRERLRAWLETEAFPQYELSTEPNYSVERPETFLQITSYSLRAAFDHKRELIARAEAAAREPAPAPAPAPAAPAAPAPAADATTDEDPNRMVGLTGNTKAWMGQIKAAALGVGSKAIWDGTALCWNVPFKAWTRLIEGNPRAGKELQVVEASGKMSRGRRR